MAGRPSSDDHGLVVDVETVTLWRPTGPQELALVESSGWRAWPPRLADQPIFYPVLNELNTNIVGTIDVVAEYR